MPATAQQSELAAILSLATRSADAWERARRNGDAKTQTEAAKTLDLARMRLRGLAHRVDAGR